jgi:hypothetical protein
MRRCIDSYMNSLRAYRRLSHALILLCGASLLSLLLPAVTVSPLVVHATSHYDWLQFNGDPQHSGNNRFETAIGTANVGEIRLRWSARLADIVDGAPVALAGIKTRTGVRDLLFLTGRSGDLMAVDSRSGRLVWHSSHRSLRCRINHGQLPCYTTSSPVIDRTRGYVYTYGLDGYVHKHHVTDGGELTDRGWPELVTRKPYDEKGSSALASTTVGGVEYLYVTSSGYPGDRGDYQGHVTTINLGTGSQHVFNALCSDAHDVHFVGTPRNPDCGEREAGVWSRAGVVYSSATGKIYISTGNGAFRLSAHNWGNSVIALKANGTGTGAVPLDSYTPVAYDTLNLSDLDVGSSAPAILPPLQGSIYPNIALHGGKDGLLRVLNLDDLSGKAGPGHSGGGIGVSVPLPQGGGIFTQPATWRDRTTHTSYAFIGNATGIAAFRLNLDSRHVPYLRTVWYSNVASTSPLIANDILYSATDHLIQARDPVTGKLLWSDTSIGTIHWQSPVVVNGVVYVADNGGRLTAYGPTTSHGPRNWLVPALFVLLILSLMFLGYEVRRVRH